MEESTPAVASGPRLSIEETPSDQLVRDAIAAEAVPVSDGRKLHVRKPGVLAQFKLVEALGPDLGANSSYVQMVTPLLYLGGIEDAEGRRPVLMPANVLQIEGLITELGEAGMDALLGWYAVKIISPMMDAIDLQKRAAADKAALKNA